MIKSSNLKNFLLLIFIVSAFSGCNIYKSVETESIKNIKLETLSVESIKFKILIPIKNPNSYSIKITDYNIDLTVNNQSIGKAISSGRIKIKANSDEVYELPVEIKFKGLFSSSTFVLLKIFKQKTINITAKGYIKTRAFFLSKKIKINENKKINILKK